MIMLIRSGKSWTKVAIAKDKLVIMSFEQEVQRTTNECTQCFILTDDTGQTKRCSGQCTRE